MSRDLLSSAQRAVVNHLIDQFDKGNAAVLLDRSAVFLLLNAFCRLAPEPSPPSLEEELYLAEGMSDRPYSSLDGGERMQYARQAAAMRARGAK